MSKKPKPLRKIVEATPPRLRAKCAYCDKIFPSSVAAREHEKTYHAKLITRLGPGDQPK
jgi:hypothetical protein